jgi:catechol 2,3-dioxygenase-like lactoylglutathione lyase family enzyme
VGITANDAEASIKWYCDVLGFRVIERWEHEGRFLGAQIESGGVVFNISQDDWKQGRERAKGLGTRVFVSMGPDVDGYANAIKARGGSLVHEPKDEWGMRAFAINDPDGFKLAFMTELAKV